MADMLSIGSSALTAYQRALATTSNNVANATTPGYSRESVAFQQRNGGGVNVVRVNRAQDLFATSQLVDATAANAAAGVVAGVATQVDKQFSSQNLSLAPPLNKMFDALDAWASAPTDSASRQAVLQAARTLSVRWTSTDRQLQALQSGLNQQADAAVSQINTLTQKIARYNQSIAVATGKNGGNPPNDLLDQRDQAVNELAAQIGVRTVTDRSGSMNVYTGSGQALVLGTQASTTHLRQSPDDGALQLQLGSGGSGASAVTLTHVNGGALGGIFSAMQQTLAPAQRALAGLANRLAEAVNTVQSAGTDAHGGPGKPLFSTHGPTLQPAASNSGTAALDATLSDAVSWPAEPVIFKYDGSTWTAVGAVSGKTYPAMGGGSTSNPLTAAGLSVTVSGTPAAGDRYTVDDRSSGLVVMLGNASQLAAANPMTATPASGNSGSAVVAHLQVTDATRTALRTPVTLQFASPTQVSINGAAPVAFNGTIHANGWSLDLRGTPDAGDRFTLSPTGAQSADNGIANLLAGLRTRAGEDGQSVVQAQSALIASVGSQTARAQGLQQAQQTLLSQTQDARDQVSGVSLDEEAADLIRFQQAYQAAAQIIASAQTLFNSLLRAAGGI